MKIIHCSDIHLDSKMEANLTARQARERNNEILSTFVQMVRYARENGVEVILIAGDLFDSSRVTAKTADYVLDTIRQAKDIDFLYLKGNHDESDKAFAEKLLPENLKQFGDDWTYYPYGGVTIAGIELSRENQSALYDTLALDASRVNIVTLHGQESTQPGEEQVCLPALKGKHINYLALGHIHSYKQGKLDLDSAYCYCGCLEGRGFDECGEKGFVLLEVEEKQVSARFVPFARRTLHEVAVDISGLLSVSQLREAMERAAADIPEKDLVKFVLQGTYTLETQKDIPFLRQMLENKFYFVKIKDESKLKIEKETYEHDISLKGEFVRMVMASQLSDEEKEQIICSGIQALSGEEIGL